MKINFLKKRKFKVGINSKIKITEKARIHLKNDEQVSFFGKEGLYDFCKKNWGFYSTPSINSRLKNNNFEVYLASNLLNRFFVFTVEKTKKNDFLNYIRSEDNQIIMRLDDAINPFQLKQKIEIGLKNLKKYCNGINECNNNKKNIKSVFKYSTAPKGEPSYKVNNYYREIVKCNNCEHFFSKHNINLNLLYKNDYSLISHGKNILRKFNRINNLKNKSDNFHRINRVLQIFQKKNKEYRLLDIGSGMGIFLYQLKKKTNWKLQGIESDKNNVLFSKNNLKLSVKNKTFKSSQFKNLKFDIITLNKVIEHLKDPEFILKDIQKILKKEGFIYIEVPDAVSAKKSKNGKNSEEFYLDHFHIFSIYSLRNVLMKCGYEIIDIKKIKEPSGKHTIYAFAKYS